MIPLRSIEGITAWRLKDLPRVALTRPAGPPEVSPAAEARWRELCAQNPRHFDGPILSVVTFDPDANEVMCRRDRYMRLAVQPRVHTGVQQLSVTAVLTARDEAGREHVLLGRRAQETRIFGGMWEIGPSGGIPAPHASVQELPADAIIAHLSDEVSEEIGLEIEQGEGVAYIRDHVAYSDDLCISCDLGRLEEVGASAANWEYTEVLWLPVDSVSVFDQANAGEIIAATRALFRVLGWVPDEV
jgi:isopentenyldiphosphate isomerase